jgi:regulator of RNase E activity RraA
VEVFGCTVKPGQLIHADKHGFLVIPEEDEAHLPDACRFMDANECRTLIPAARTSAGKTIEEVLREMDEAGRRFGEAVKKQFGAK